MEQIQKDYAQTNDSFYPLRPIENQGENLFVAQIQQLISSLVKKKAELREEKVRQESLREKTNKQEERIGELKIGMEHQIESERMELANRKRLEEVQAILKKQIKEIVTDKAKVKDEVNKTVTKIANERRDYDEMNEMKNDLQTHYRERKAENGKLDEQIQNVQTILTYAQNDIRAKQDEITKQKLEENQLLNLLDFLKQKILVNQKERNMENSKKSKLQGEIIKTEQKVNNFREEKGNMNWDSEQVSSQAYRIKELNEKLHQDLDKVQKHLGSMKKVNKILKDKLSEYGMTSERVARLVMH